MPQANQTHTVKEIWGITYTHTHTEDNTRCIMLETEAHGGKLISMKTKMQDFVSWFYQKAKDATVP